MEHAGQWPLHVSLHSHSFPIPSHFSYYLLPFCSYFVSFYLKIAACHSQMCHKCRRFKWQSTDEAFRCSPDYLLTYSDSNKVISCDLLPLCSVNKNKTNIAGGVWHLRLPPSLHVFYGNCSPHCDIILLWVHPVWIHIVLREVYSWSDIMEWASIGWWHLWCAC